jgi:hypothetical protein
LQQELEGFVSDAILRVVQLEAQRFGRHTLATFRVVCEELAQMQLTDILMVSFEGLPCLALSKRRDFFCHF